MYRPSNRSRKTPSLPLLAAWLFALLVCGWSGAARAAEPPSIKIGLTQPPALPANQSPTIEIEFDQLAGGVIKFELDGLTKASSVDIYPVTSTAEDRQKKTCSLPLDPGQAADKTRTVTLTRQALANTSAPCRELLKATADWQAILREPGTTNYAIIKFSYPSRSRKAGQEPRLVYDVDSEQHGLELEGWLLPDKSVDCYLFTDDWVKIEAKNCLTEPQKIKPDILARVTAWPRKPVKMVVKLPGNGPWVDVPIAPKEKSWVAWCDDKHEAQLAATHAPLSPPYYRVCVDLTNTSNPPLVRMMLKSGVWQCANDPFVLESGIPIQVFVKKKSGRIDIKLSGNIDNPPLILDTPVATRVAKVDEESNDAPVRSYFPGQTGSIAELTVTFTAKPAGGDATDKAPAAVTAFHRNFAVENFYRGIFRLGVAASYAWNASAYSTHTTTGGNKYVGLDAGPGINSGEIMAGYSIFIYTSQGGDKGMSDLHTGWGLDWYGGLGVAKVDATGVKALTSFRTGPELAYGLLFSGGLTVGFERHDYLAEGIKPNGFLPPGLTTPPTKFGVTPSVGLVLNFSGGASIAKYLGALGGS